MFAIMTHVLLVSPTNRLYIVSRDKTAVKELCQTNGIRYGYNMNEMCGLHDAHTGGHKQHVENWVLAERMQFIQENNDTTMHPIIGAQRSLLHRQLRRQQPKHVGLQAGAPQRAPQL